MKNMITSLNEIQCRGVLNYVFDNFDFNRVIKVMNALDWKYSNLTRLDPKNEFKAKKVDAIPTLDEVKEIAAKLMWDCANNDIDVISSGGFRVEKDFINPDDPWMRLTFEVTDTDTSFSEI